MPRQQHHPWDVKRFNQGANRDQEDEFIGSISEGEYIDGNNVRPTADTGDQAALKKINGETEKFTNNLGGTTYKCIGKIEVNSKIVEFWVDTNKTLASIIRVDGDVVLKSTDFPIDVDHPLQIDKNESCIGGEIYVTDDFNRPMFFNVQDMIDSLAASSTKYFADFDLSKFILSLETVLDHPVFIRRETVGAGGGLPVGMYQYAIRFVTDDGDRTAFSVSTPLIPVPAQASALSTQYPSVKTIGAVPSPTVDTSIGLRIRFRVNNLLDYDFVEIKRVAFNAGQPLGTIPSSEIIARIDIFPQEVSVRDFVDPGDQTQIPETITDEEDTQQLSAIKRCKTLRYFEQRLHLMNVEFESRDLDNTPLSFLQTSGNEMFEVIQDLGITGYNDSFQHAYNQSYRRGERYGFAVVGYDDRGERTLAQKVPNFNNHLMPNRRDELSADTIANSPLGSVTANSVSDNNTNTAEVFDLTQSVRKTDFCEVKNIATDGSKPEGVVNNIFNRTGAGSGSCTDLDGVGVFNRVNASALGYQPYHPTTASDNTTSHDFQVNPEVHLASNTFAKYQPKGYAPRYYGLGMALSGLDNIPSYMKAFSVVRTEPAGRVVAQGLGVYKLTKAPTSNNGLGVVSAFKDRDRLWFFSPDIDKGFVGSATIQDILNDPGNGNYQVQLVSPLGFFSEVYNEHKISASQSGTPFTLHQGIDIMSYARILFEDGTINIGDTTGTIGNAGYVKFGDWRNTSVNPNASGTTIFTLKDFTEHTTESGLGTFYEIKLDKEIYNIQTSGGLKDFNNSAVKNFHEPFYIINIVQTGKNVPDTDITEYTETGHYQKIESIIGKSDGSADQEYALVDERWEDCIPALSLAHATAGDDRFVWVQDTSGQQFRWQNITFKTPAQITAILAALTTGQGVFRHENVNNREFLLKFDFPTFAPPTDSLILVKYDNTVPIKVFGGDTLIGESIFTTQDNEYPAGGGKFGNYATDNNAFGLFVGWPYYKFEISPRVYIVNNAGAAVDKIQDNNTASIDFIRQMAFVFTCETKVDQSLYFSGSGSSQFFPHIHYVMRPNRWDTDDPTDNIQTNYFTDYPGEDSRWILGGIRYIPSANVDYSSTNIERSHTSKPVVGFEEETEFCTLDTWSALRPINVQDAPGVRTFPVANRFTVSDDQGEIKFAWSATSSKSGHNLYAVCEEGVAMLLVNKRILSNATGDDELVVKGGAETDVTLDERWISTNVGMNDEFWRSFAEWDNALYFANKNSVYKLFDNNLEDIGRIKYHSKLYNDSLSRLQADFSDEVTGVYDTLHNEYWLQINRINKVLILTNKIEQITASDNLLDGDIVNLTPGIVPGTGDFDIWVRSAGDNLTLINNSTDAMNFKSFDSTAIITLQPGEAAVFTMNADSTYSAVLTTTPNLSNLFIFSEVTKHWIGEFSYRFDQYLSFDNRTYGFRSGQTFELNKGNQISLANITADILQASSKEQISGKEFIRLRVASDNKPTKVEFFNDLTQTVVQSELDPTASSFYLKDYDGFEQFISRKLASADASRPRMQGRLLIYKIIHNLAEEFKVIDSAIQYKILK